MANVTIRYNGNTICELTDAGSARLNTANTICRSNIIVAYSPPAQLEGEGSDNVLLSCITELTLDSSAASSLTTSTFANYPNLTTISVPWSVDEVPGAPWGAANASVVYLQ